jgi:hypothetical protein
MLLMVVNDLHIVRTPIAPYETETPLVVDANTVLAFSLAMQRLQAIPRRRCQVAKFCGAVQLAEFSARDLLDCLKAPAALALVKPLSLQTAERPNHKDSIFCIAFNVKHHTSSVKRKTSNYDSP